MYSDNENDNTSKRKYNKQIKNEKENNNNYCNVVDREENCNSILNTKNYKQKENTNICNIVSITNINKILLENFMLFEEFNNEVSKSFILDLIICLNRDNNELNSTISNLYSYFKRSKEFNSFDCGFLEYKLNLANNLLNKGNINEAYNCINSDSPSIYPKESEIYKRIISQKLLIKSKILFKMNSIQIVEEGKCLLKLKNIIQFFKCNQTRY